jgi:hypothetical protein
MIRAGLVAATVVALALLAPRAVRAQRDAAPASDLVIARELYEAGVRAAEAQAWAEAEAAFARSYARAPTLPALANLVTARVRLERVVGARDALVELLERYSGLSAERRSWAERTRVEIDQRIARIRVSGLPAPDIARVSLDGGDVDPATEREDGVLVIEVDPGSHTIVVEQDGAEDRVMQAEVGPGEERVVHVLPAVASVDARGDEVIEAGPSIVEEPALWLGIAAGVAVIAAVVIAIAVATQPPEDRRLAPRSGIVFEL